MDQTPQRLTSALAASRANQADKPAATTPTVSPPFLTRKQLLLFLNSEGIPIGKSTLDKLCALVQGPPVAAWWGRLGLHRPAQSLAWAMARLRLVHVGGVAQSGTLRRRGIGRRHRWGPAARRLEVCRPPRSRRRGRGEHAPARDCSLSLVCIRPARPPVDTTSRARSAPPIVRRRRIGRRNAWASPSMRRAPVGDARTVVGPVRPKATVRAAISSRPMTFAMKPESCFFKKSGRHPSASRCADRTATDGFGTSNASDRSSTGTPELLRPSPASTQ